jgi:hypothetical protein
MTKSSVRPRADEITRTASQVRATTRGQRTIHRLIGAVKAPDGGGRAYRTACQRDLPTQHAVLTTAKADCAECKAAT